MAAITICSDFGTPQNEVWHRFHCFPIDFPDAMILVFGMLSFKSAFHSLSLSSRGFLVPLHFQCLVSVSYRVLICCTCLFQSGSLFFVYFSFFCLQVSSMSNFSPDTRGWRWSLIRLSCSVVLWWARSTANKYHWYLWGLLAVYGSTSKSKRNNKVST